MITMAVFPFQEKTHMVEPGIEPGTSWLVVRSSDHQATRLVCSEHVEDTKKIKNLNINLGNVHFVDLYCIITKVTKFLKAAKVENNSF